MIAEIHSNLQIVTPDTSLGCLLSILGKGIIPGKIIGRVIGAVNVMMLKDKSLVGVACGVKIVYICSWGTTRARI